MTTGARASADIEQNTTAASGFTITDRKVVRYDNQSLDFAEMRGGILVVGGTLRSQGGAVTYELEFSDVGDCQLHFNAELTGERMVSWPNRLFWRYATHSRERFYGFGQQMTHFDQKGRVLPILVQEHGVGRGLPVVTELVALKYGPRTAGNWATTEVSVPQYISSDLRSLFLENTEYSVFDLSDPDVVQVEVFTDHLHGQVLYGTSPLQLIQTYTNYAGRMRELPPWVHTGAIVAVQGGTDAALRHTRALADADVPVAALWIQDWAGVNRTAAGSQVQWDWEMDTTLYPRWPELRQELADTLDAKVLLYVNPFLTDFAGHNSLYQEAARRGYLVMTKAGAPYLIPNSTFSAGLVDLSNPDARQWLKGLIATRMVAGAGASGWMADFGEALPFDAVISSGESAAYWHNRYAEEWARLNREVLEENGLAADGLFFSRSGYSRSPGLSTLFWVGDQLQGWDEFDGLKSAIAGCLSGGLSGFSLVHSDTGGFDSIDLPGQIPVMARSKELLLRWAEFSAFTPVLRTHQGIDPSAAWQVDADPDTLSRFRRCVQMYVAWAPYRRRLVAEAAATGHPVMRHLFLHYPGDALAGLLRHQYMLGPDMLVAPVTEPGRDNAHVYVPAGTWTHVWSGQRIDAGSGGWHNVAAPLGEPAVFVRDGSDAAAELLAAFGRLGPASGSAA